MSSGSPPPTTDAHEPLHQMRNESVIENGSHEQYGWFQNTGPGLLNDQSLKPAQKIVQGHEQFLSKLSPSLRTYDSQLQVVNTKDALEQQITSYRGRSQMEDGLKQQAGEAMKGASEAVVRYERDRMAGRRKIGRKIQSFTNSFAEFLAVYSGVVEQLAGAGQVYGAVAYETLSIFFVVVVNKAGNDSRIADLLSELQKSFPQLDEWVNIYPSPSLRMSVVEVYKEVILFSRHAAEYFSKFSTRLLMAIGKPPSMGIDKTVATIQAKLADVTTECRIQLHTRTKQINTVVEDSNIRIRYLQRENAVLVGSLERFEAHHRKFVEEVELRNQQEDSQGLEAFKIALQITYPSPKTDVEGCRITQSQAFSGLELKYTQMSLDLLRTSSAYQQWQSAAESRLLFLGGATQTQGRNSPGYTHCWLSPATTYVVDTMRAQGRKVAYYCLHPGIRADSRDVHEGKQLVASILYQVLMWNTVVLRRKHEAFHSMVVSDMWQRSENDAAAISITFRLLRDVLAESRDIGTVYLVLDRVELCNWKLHYLMNALAELVMDDTCNVKIMATAAPAPSQHWDAEEIKHRGNDRVLVHQGWDQRTLSRLEIQTLERASLAAKSKS